MLSVRKSVLLSVSLACLSFLFVDAAQAQVQLPRGFSSFSGYSSLYLLIREDVRKELELLDEQSKQITALNEKSRTAMREAYSGLRDLSREERTKKYAEIREQQQESRKELEKEVNEKILLPHQKKRLAQIRFQMQLRRYSGGSAFTSQTVTEALSIDEQQQEKIKELQSEVDQELRDQIAKLREEARKKILSQLTPQQQAKYEELVGDQFEFNTTSRFNGGNFRRGGGLGGQQPNK